MLIAQHIEPEQPEHFGLLQIQARTLAAPETGLNDVMLRADSLAASSFAGPFQPPGRHFRGRFERCHVRFEMRRNQKTGTIALNLFLPGFHHGIRVGSRGQLDEQFKTRRGLPTVDRHRDVWEFRDAARSIQTPVQPIRRQFRIIQPVGVVTRRQPDVLVGRDSMPRQIPGRIVNVASKLKLHLGIGRLQELEAQKYFIRPGAESGEKNQKKQGRNSVNGASSNQADWRGKKGQSRVRASRKSKAGQLRNDNTFVSCHDPFRIPISYFFRPSTSGAASAPSAWESFSAYSRASLRRIDSSAS